MDKEWETRAAALHPRLAAATAAVIACFAAGGKLLLCGNGGSAADCGHIAGELLKGFLKKRPLPPELCAAVPGAAALQGGLPALDLTAQAPALTAIANDLGGEAIFAQQVLAYGRAQDLLLGISTSGNAANVLLAMRIARARGLKTIALTGRGGGALAGACDILLDVDETETYRVQEKHLPLYHTLCAAVEAHFFAV